MRIFDLIKMGLRNLLRRKARTLLTVIGVIIGTVSIVVMISVGIGMNESFEAVRHAERRNDDHPGFGRFMVGR